MKEINISKMIMTKRKEKKITQDELAQYIGVSKAAISKWETGQSYPDITLLPILAAYFDVSIDELIGYEPQMAKEDIKKLYIKLCDDFATLPFEDVIEECKQIIKKYYACYPLLLQMGIILLNHSMLASRSEETTRLNEQAKLLFQRVKTQIDEVELAQQALHLEAYCCLLLGEPEMGLQLLEGSNRPKLSSDVVKASAYQMLGQMEKAKSAIQIGLYEHLMGMIENYPTLLMLTLPDQKKFKDSLERVMQLDQVFNLRQLNPSIVLPVLLVAAQGYVQFGQCDRALDYLEDYAKIVKNKFYPLKFRGDQFFDVIEDWLEEYEIGTYAPRNEKIIQQSIVEALTNNPMFVPLQQEARFIKVIKELKSSH